MMGSKPSVSILISPMERALAVVLATLLLVVSCTDQKMMLLSS
jgi:hypothetical protein